MSAATAIVRRMAVATVTACFAIAANATVNLWEAAKHFQYNIEKIGVTPGPAATPQSYSVRIVFSVTDPTDPTHVWDIQNALPFTTSPAQLTLDIGWAPGTDFTNAGGVSGSLALISPAAVGTGAALPVQVRNLVNKAAVPLTAFPCTPADCATSAPNRFFAIAKVTPTAFPALPKTGRVVLEGRPVCKGVSGINCDDPPVPANINIPVTTATANFTFAPTTPLSARLPDTQDPRRPIVAIDKCKGCHDGTDHGTGIVPRLSLHGENRNENLGACVVCHNPNQTDVPYRRPVVAVEDARIAGPEVAVDFKVMVHSIHSGGFREQPFVVIGRNSSVNDFSSVRFPKELRDCTLCHIDSGGKGTFELPLRAGVLGTTVKTQSGYLATPRTIDVDPSNDTKISPTAAVCSACHDKSEVKSHMVRTGGASFATTQKALNAPQGLAIVAVSPKAWGIMERRQTPIASLCLDLTYWRGYHASMRFTQENWSVPSSYGKGPKRSSRSIHGPSGSYVLAKALKASLDEIEAEGEENVFRRHRIASRALREGIRAMGFATLASEDNAAPTSTCIHVGGDAFDVQRFGRMLYEEYGIVTSGGSPTIQSGSYVGFRVGTMGQSASPLCVFAFLAAMEEAMSRLGYQVNEGAALPAAQAVFAQGE